MGLVNEVDMLTPYKIDESPDLPEGSLGPRTPIFGLEGELKTATAHPSPVSSPPPVQLPDLPVELIEKIYIYSRNLHLPKANRYLHEALNAEAVHMYLCSSIFNATFTSKYHYTDFNFCADNQKDKDLVKLQTDLLHQPWFNLSLARRLGGTTPTLRARALHRRNDDGNLRHGLQPSDWPVNVLRTGVRVVGLNSIAAPINVHMPERFLIGTWTDEKIEMFHLLRSWYIDPRISGNGPKTMFRQARQQAAQDGRKDVVAEMEWYIRAESTGVYGGIMVPSFFHDRDLRQQYDREMEDATSMPIPDEADT